MYALINAKRLGESNQPITIAIVESNPSIELLAKTLKRCLLKIAQIEGNTEIKEICGFNANVSRLSYAEARQIGLKKDLIMNLYNGKDGEYMDTQFTSYKYVHDENKNLIRVYNHCEMADDFNGNSYEIVSVELGATNA